LWSALLEYIEGRNRRDNRTGKGKLICQDGKEKGTSEKAFEPDGRARMVG